MFNSRVVLRSIACWAEFILVLIKMRGRGEKEERGEGRGERGEGRGERGEGRWGDGVGDGGWGMGGGSFGSDILSIINIRDEGREEMVPYGECNTYLFQIALGKP